MKVPPWHGKEWLAWRLLDRERRLGKPGFSAEPVAASQTFHAIDWQDASLQGLHGFTRLTDAVEHGHGWIVCRVRLGGTTRLRRGGKIDATELTVLWMGDATDHVRGPLCDLAAACLEQERLDERDPDPHLWAAIAARRALIAGTATNATWEEAKQQPQTVLRDVQERDRVAHAAVMALGTRLQAIRIGRETASPDEQAALQEELTRAMRGWLPIGAAFGAATAVVAMDASDPKSVMRFVGLVAGAFSASHSANAGAMRFQALDAVREPFYRELERLLTDAFAPTNDGLSA